jgi:hypothetical protein
MPTPAQVYGKGFLIGQKIREPGIRKSGKICGNNVKMYRFGKLIIFLSAGIFLDSHYTFSYIFKRCSGSIYVNLIDGRFLKNSADNVAESPMAHKKSA